MANSGQPNTGRSGGSRDDDQLWIDTIHCHTWQKWMTMNDWLWISLFFLGPNCYCTWGILGVSLQWFKDRFCKWLAVEFPILSKSLSREAVRSSSSTLPITAFWIGFHQVQLGMFGCWPSNTTPKMNECHLKRDLPTSIFQGQAVSFRGSSCFAY